MMGGRGWIGGCDCEAGTHRHQERRWRGGLVVDGWWLVVGLRSSHRGQGRRLLISMF